MKTKIFVVSMKDARERRDKFLARAKDARVGWQFFDAATGPIPALTLSPNEMEKHLGRQLRDGEIGCYASHYSLWMALDEDESADQYIILEDDVIADWSILSELSKVDFGKLRIDYLRLFAKFPEKFLVRQKSFLWFDRFLIEFIGRPFGTQGYVITKSGARHWIKALETVRFPIDYAMDRSWDHGQPNYALYPFPIIEEAVASSIGMSRHSADTKILPQNSKFRTRDIRKSRFRYGVARTKQIFSVIGNAIARRLRA